MKPGWVGPGPARQRFHRHAAARASTKPSYTPATWMNGDNVIVINAEKIVLNRGAKARGGRVYMHHTLSSVEISRSARARRSLGGKFPERMSERAVASALLTGMGRFGRAQFGNLRVYKGRRIHRNAAQQPSRKKTLDIAFENRKETWRGRVMPRPLQIRSTAPAR